MCIVCFVCRNCGSSKIKLPYDPAIFIVIYTKTLKTESQTFVYKCLQQHYSQLLLDRNNLSAHSQMNGNKTYYSVTKGNEVLTHATSMNLEGNVN